MRSPVYYVFHFFLLLASSVKNICKNTLRTPVVCVHTPQSSIILETKRCQRKKKTFISVKNDENRRFRCFPTTAFCARARVRVRLQRKSFTSRTIDVFSKSRYRLSSRKRSWFSVLPCPGVVCGTVYARHYVKFDGRPAERNTVVNGRRLCRSYAWEKRQVFRHTGFFLLFTPPAAAAACSTQKQHLYLRVCTFADRTHYKFQVPPLPRSHTHTHTQSHSHSGIGRGERFCSTATTFGVYV